MRGTRLNSSRSQYLFQFARPNHGIDYRDVFLDLVAVAFDEAPGDDQFLGAATRLVVRHFEDRIHRLLLSRVDKRAGIHDYDVGIFGLASDLGTGGLEHAHHDLAIDEVLGAAQADKTHLGRRIPRAKVCFRLVWSEYFVGHLVVVILPVNAGSQFSAIGGSASRMRCRLLINRSLGRATSSRPALRKSLAIPQHLPQNFQNALAHSAS